MTSLHRRDFLSQLGALPIGLSLGAITQAAAQTTGSGYRALVCINMNGGNDAFNTVLATDSTSWGPYQRQRSAQASNNSIALPAPGLAPNLALAGSLPERLGGVLPIGHGARAVHASRQFALHPALPQLQQLYQAGRLAIVANVGPLARPTTKADYADPRKARPRKLFSHNDQQSTWLSFQPEGALQGWAGLMGDALMSGNGAGHSGTELDIIRRAFTCMTPGGASVWLAGRQVTPYQSSTTHVTQLGSSGAIFGSARLQAAAAVMLGQARGGGTPVATNNLFASELQKLGRRALQASALMGDVLVPLGVSPWSTPGVTNPGNDPLLTYVSPVDGTMKFNPLALQLQMVARLIDTNRAGGLGLSRQFFMVSFGGFDTHSAQIASHADRMAQLNHAMAYFDMVLGAMPHGDLRSAVTTFTASEFGRTFTNNGDGTDHGWGGHHVVMGGAVNGAEVYGTFPDYSSADSQGLFSSPHQIDNGVLLPTTSVDHMAYTLGKWMGVPTGTLLGGMLPNLAQFASDGHDLGFMSG